MKIITRLLIIFFFVVVFFKSESKISAVACGESGTAFGCGAVGGCGTGEMCTEPPGGGPLQCFAVSQCAIQPSPTRIVPTNAAPSVQPGPTSSSQPNSIICGDTGTRFACGAAGGCDSGEMCIDPPGGGPLGCFAQDTCVGVSPGPTICGNSGTNLQCGAAGGCAVGEMCREPAGVGQLECIIEPKCGGVIDTIEEFQLCNQAGAEGSAERDKCDKCYKEDGVWTGIGCIPYMTSTGTIKALITVGLGLSGTVVVLMTLAGAFMLTTSQGDPKRVDEAKSLITSAIAGILFIIFSVTILRFIGVNILQIPAFG